MERVAGSYVHMNMCVHVNIPVCACVCVCVAGRRHCFLTPLLLNPFKINLVSGR